MGSAEQKKACIEEGASAKDYLPWGYELISWPDGITLWALILTGFAIVWQSYETRKAAIATQVSANATNSQIRMMKDKERARITVVFPPKEPDFSSPERLAFGSIPELFMNVKISVFNDGQTWAFNVTGWGNMGIGGIEEMTFSEGGREIRLPKVIRGVSPNDAVESGFFQVLSSEDTDAVESGGPSFFMYGEIRYEDVFGESHCTPFRFRWSVYGGKQDIPEWEDRSPPST